jgi:plastocyanin
MPTLARPTALVGRAIIISAAGLLALLLMATMAVPAAAQGEETVRITNTLEPAQLEVEAGTTITWRNEGDERRRMRSREGPEEFDSGNLEPGESFSHTFTIEGSYPYADHRDDENPDYFGMIIVGASGGAADGPLPDTGSVSIIDRSFRPASFSIATGGTIEWSNDDGEAHTVTATDSAFDSGILNGGATFSEVFPAPGSFPYFCLIHPEMRGTITVSDAVDPALATPAAVDPVAAESPAPLPSSPTPAGPIPTDTAASTGSPVATAGVDATAEISPGMSPGQTGSLVSIVDRSFQPVDIQVKAGDSVAWTNDDTEGHTVTATDGAFNSGVLTIGDGFSTAFETAGTFDYFCAIHPDMKGTVTVAEPVT